MRSREKLNSFELMLKQFLDLVNRWLLKILVSVVVIQFYEQNLVKNSLINELELKEKKSGVSNQGLFFKNLLVSGLIKII